MQSKKDNQILHLVLKVTRENGQMASWGMTVRGTPAFSLATTRVSPLLNRHLGMKAKIVTFLRCTKYKHLYSSQALMKVQKDTHRQEGKWTPGVKDQKQLWANQSKGNMWTINIIWVMLYKYRSNSVRTVSYCIIIPFCSTIIFSSFLSKTMIITAVNSYRYLSCFRCYTKIFMDYLIYSPQQFCNT